MSFQRLQEFPPLHTSGAYGEYSGGAGGQEEGRKSPEWKDLDMKRDWVQDMQFLNDKGYDFIRAIGEGAYAEVWEVEDTKNDKLLAGKIIELKRYKGSAPVKVAVKYMLKEVEILKTIRHKNIVNFEAVLNIPDKQFQSTNIFVFLFMELCDGSLERQLMSKRWMDENESRNWFRQIGEGLKYLHGMNVSHMDIKPPNILYASVGNQFVYKLSDFGFAMSFEANEPNVVTYELGTPVYMAPEFSTYRSQILTLFGRKVSHMTKPCDIFSLGISLTESLVGLGILDDMIKATIGTGKWLGLQNCLCCLLGRSFSSELLDMLTQMIESNPNNRLTIEEVLNHPWVMTTEVW